MNSNRKSIYLTIFIFCCQIAFSQNNRISHNNVIGWFNAFGTFKINEKIGLHTEYQFRRNQFVTEWQQSLLRIGINYSINPRVLFRVGYAWIETFPYGEFPINGLGRDFTEHRLFEMVQLSHKEGIVDLSHRFMLEQRFVGRYSSALAENEDEYPLLHRARYMARIQFPLKGNAIIDRTPYAVLYDEIFIGFGNNVNANIFDQNRLGLLLGYRYNKNIRFEGGYLNQILQFGRQINGQNVIQYNHGFIFNALLNFDLSKK